MATMCTVPIITVTGIRRVGRIKWFGGYNSKRDSINDFGFVEDNTNQSIFIHLNELLCERSDLEDEDGVIVTFEVVQGWKGLEARNVLLIENETDRSIIEACAQIPALWDAVLSKYGGTLSSTELVTFFKNNGSAFTVEHVKMLLKCRTDHLLFSAQVWVFLSDAVQANVCVQYLNGEVWGGPFSYIDIWEMLSEKGKIQVLQHLLKQGKEPYEMTLTVAIITAFSASEQVNLLWGRLVNGEPEAWLLLSREGQLAALRQLVEQQKEVQGIHLTADIVQGLPPDTQIQLLWVRLLDGEPEAWALLSRERQTATLRQLVEQQKEVKWNGLTAEVVQGLPANIQVELVWPILSDTNADLLSNPAQTLALYRHVQDNRSINWLPRNKTIKALLQLIKSQSDDEKDKNLYLFTRPSSTILHAPDRLIGYPSHDAGYRDDSSAPHFSGSTCSPAGAGERSPARGKYRPQKTRG